MRELPWGMSKLQSSQEELSSAPKVKEESPGTINLGKEGRNGGEGLTIALRQKKKDFLCDDSSWEMESPEFVIKTIQLISSQGN